MSRNFLDLLKGFTPDGSGLDRDSLLFEAGRASAPSPARAWLVAALLALTLTLTVGFLPQRDRTPGVPSPAPAESTVSPGESRPLVLRGKLPPNEPTLAADEMMPNAPPLRPFDRSIPTSLE